MRATKVLFLGFFLIFLLLHSLSGYCVDNRIIFGIYENKPLVYIEDGKPKGIYVDIINNFVAANNIEVVFYFDSFSNLLELCKNGKIDVITAIAYSKERERFFDFSSEAVIINWGEIFLHKDNIKNFDISHMRITKYTIGVVKGDIYFKEFEETTKKLLNIDPVYVYFKDYKEILDAVQKKIVDMGIVGRFFGFMNRNLYKDIEPLSIFIKPVELKFAFRKGFDKNVIKLLDNHLLSLKYSGYFHSRIIDQYIPIEKGFFLDSPFIKYGFFVIISLFSLLIISILIGIILKREIDKHTKTLKKLVEEKDLLIKELHHRIKNNLQIIKSMAFIQMASPISESATKDIELLYKRIEVLGEFHKILYEYEMFEKVSSTPLFEEFVKKVMSNKKNIELEIFVDTFEVDIEKSIQIGILVGEVILFIMEKINLHPSNYLKFIIKKINKVVYITFEYKGPCQIIVEDFINNSTTSEIFKLMLKQLKDDYKISKEGDSCSLTISFLVD